MKIAVGLGNPGKEYEATRHNVGWMVLDRLAERAGWTGRTRARDAAATVYGRYRDLDLMLVKPMTFMNLSGVAVRKVLARQRAPLEDVLVVVDDFALPLGRLRLRADGSAGGHNGLRSIIGELGSQDFARLRVGIGEPSRAAVDHVLSRFATDEQKLVDEVVDAAADAVEDWAREGAGRAANRWNAWRPEETHAPEVPEVPEVSEGSKQPDAPTDETNGGAGDAPVATRPTGSPTGEPGIVRRLTGWRRILPRAEQRE